MKTNFRKGLQYLQPNRRHLGHKAWLGSGKGNGDEHAPIFTKKRANERPARNQQTGEAALEYEDSWLIPKYGIERESCLRQTNTPSGPRKRATTTLLCSFSPFFDLRRQNRTRFCQEKYRNSRSVEQAINKAITCRRENNHKGDSRKNGDKFTGLD